MTSPYPPTYSPSGRSRVAPGVSTVDLLDLSIAALASSVAASQPIRKLAEQSDDGVGDGGGGVGGDSNAAAGDATPSSSAAGDSLDLQKDGSQKNVRTKLDGTVVTDADGAAQRIIVAALRHVSEDVRIVGEEERKEMESSQSRDFEEAARRFLEMEVSGNDSEEVAAAAASSEQKLHDDKTSEEGATVEHEIAGIFQMVREEITGHYSEAVARNLEMPDIHENESKAKSLLKYQRGYAGDGDEAEHDVGDRDTTADGSQQQQPLHGPSLSSEEHNNKTAAAPMLSPRDRVVDSSRVSVLIDPLDGTSCYASGRHECVTTLVAVVLDNTPIFGVICKPFGHADEPCILNSGCFAVYGGVLLGGVYVAGGDEIERSISRRIHRPGMQQSPSCHLRRQVCNGNGKAEQSASATASACNGETVPNQRRTAVISKSRAGGVVGRCIQALADEGLLRSDPVFISGAGVKALNLLVGSNNESLWFFPKAGTSLWDVAAADALLRVVGGRLSDKYGRDIDYSKSRQDAENNDGVVACNDAALHEECIRLFQEADWRDED